MSPDEDFARLDVIVDLFRKESSKSRMADPRGQVFAKHDSYFYSPEDVRDYLDKWRAARAKDGDEFQGIVVKDPNEDINPDKEIEDEQWQDIDGADPEEEDEDAEEAVPEPPLVTRRFQFGSEITDEERALFRAQQAAAKAEKDRIAAEKSEQDKIAAEIAAKADQDKYRDIARAFEVGQPAQQVQFVRRR